MNAFDFPKFSIVGFQNYKQKQVKDAQMFKALLVLVVVLAPHSLLAQSKMRVHFIDVGQGDATLVEFDCGAILIDAGAEIWRPSEWGAPLYDGQEALFEYLEDFFASRPDLDNRLEALYLTHPHADHTRAVPLIIDEYEPKNIIHNGQRGGSGSDGQYFAKRYAREDDGVGGWYVLERNTRSPSGDPSDIIDQVDCAAVDPVITILWGQVEDRSGWDYDDFSDENNHSLVIKIEFGLASILFTGDLEFGHRSGSKAAIERLVERYENTDVLDVDVYQVGHHGSANGTNSALVEAMSPKIAVLSHGPACKRRGYNAWQFGHPRNSVIDVLEAGVSETRIASKTVRTFDKPKWWDERTISKAIYSTGWDGTVVLEADAAGNWAVDLSSDPHECLN